MNNEIALNNIIGFISSGLQKGPTPSEIAWLVCNALSTLEISDCSVYFSHDEDNLLIQEAANNKTTNALKQLTAPHKLYFGEGIVGMAAQMQQPIIVDDTSLTPNYVLDESLGKSELSVPIIYNDNVLGVIDSESPSINFYQRYHVMAFELVAALIAPWIASPQSSDNLLRRRKSDIQKASRKYGLTFQQQEELNKKRKQYLPYTFDFMKRVEREEYNSALHLFLKHFTKPNILKYVPALDEALNHYNDQGFKDFITERLKDEIKLCIDEVFLASPKTQKYHFIIEHTYISPLASHQVVADRLGMSYSTFARHLAKARSQLLDQLWEKVMNIAMQFNQS